MLERSTARAALVASTVTVLALAPLATAAPVESSPPAAVVAAFPTDSPAAVHTALVRMQEDPRRNAWMRRAIAARAAWRPLVDGTLAEAGIPAELAEVPLVKSGYTNWRAPGEVSYASLAPGIAGRGLWMFNVPTAREYGLKVEGSVDERLETVRETEAAVALLADLHDTFGDWGLALAGYNQGMQGWTGDLLGRG